MMERSVLFFLLLILAGCILFAGCTAPRLSDTHNATLVVQAYNTWAGQQETYAGVVHSSLSQIGSTINDYNRDTVAGSLNPGLLKGDIASDQQTIALWGASTPGLASASDAFVTGTSTLSFGSDTETPWLTGLLGQEMKIYSIDMGNAQQHFVDYNRDLTAYLSQDNPDYRDDSLRAAAMDAKAKALSSLNDGDAALTNVTETAHQLEQIQ